MDKFCEDCVHNEVCQYGAIPPHTNRCNDKDTLEDIMPRGEWIEDDYAGIHCSECSFIPLKDVVIKIYADGTKEKSGNYNLTPCCPNCGAAMRGKGKND